MNFNVFELTILSLQKLKEDQIKLKDLGVDLIDYTHHLVSCNHHLLGTIYGEHELHIIDWWCYDNDFGNNGFQMHDENDNLVCSDLKDLWIYLEKECSNEGEYKIEFNSCEELNYLKNLFKIH